MEKEKYQETSKDINSNVVEFLKQEEKLLREKANKMLDNNDFAMYSKLINAYETVVQLIKKYDWQLMHQEYEDQVDSEHSQKQVSVWEQNGDGQIRNHRVWNIADNTNNKNDNSVYNINFNVDADKIKDIDSFIETLKSIAKVQRHTI